MRCEVILDLLPLYVDGDCSQGSKELVEEHLKRCPKCMKQFDSMTKNVPIACVPNKDISLKRMFRKIWIGTVIVSLLLFMMVSPFVYNWRKIMGYGPGIIDSNRKDVKNMERIMDVWKEQGYEVAINEMEPKVLYEELCEPITIEDWTGDFDDKWKYQKIDIANQVFYTRSRNIDLTEPLTTVQQEMQIALEKKDDVEFWKSAMKNKTWQLVVTQEIYDMVNAKYPEVTQEHWYQMKWESGVYYYYWNEENMGNLLKSTFSLDMYEKVQSIREVEQEFFILADAIAIPEELYEEFVQTCEKIEGWLLEYAQYYRNLGYYNFEKQWRQEMIAILKELEEDGSILSSYEFNKSKDIFQATDEPAHAWRMKFGTAFSENEYVYLYLYSEDESCFLSHAGHGFGLYKEYEELPEDLRMRLDKMVEKLNYSDEKYGWWS